jgi:hypothetical protein
LSKGNECPSFIAFETEIKNDSFISEMLCQALVGSHVAVSNTAGFFCGSISNVPNLIIF